VTYPLAFERIHGAEPAPLSRSVPVPCAICMAPAQVLVMWEEHSGHADEWWCARCADAGGVFA